MNIDKKLVGFCTNYDVSTIVYKEYNGYLFPFKSS